MPTADQRLDQLEPIISELLARQDETAAKVERVSAQVRQLTITTTTALTTQSNNIEFLLVKTTQIEQRLDSMDQRFASMNQRFDSMDQRFDSMDQHFTSMDQQLGHLGQQVAQLTDFLREKLK
ncbi:MAG: hypothetical protein ACRYG7_35445 [Janthinobacterium lividum]